MPIDALNGIFPNGIQPGQAGPAQGADGVFMGHAVRVENSAEDLLADAAEELAFSADKTDEFELKERREKGRSASLMAEKVRLYQELMHKAGKTQNLTFLRSRINVEPWKSSILQKAKEFFPDPSDAWAALSELHDELAGDSSKAALRKELGEALKQLEAESGPAIRAGIQGALAAAGFPELGGTDELRDVYRDTVGEFSSVTEVFGDIKARFGGDFEKAMDFLFSALSADMACDEPSMGLKHLEDVNGKLGKVRLTQSAFLLCEAMDSRWHGVHGVEGGTSPMSLLEDVISLRDQRFVGRMHVDAMLEKAKAPDVEHEVLFLQDLLQTVRNMPPAFFDGDEQRMKVYDAVQESVDAAVEREDEYLAQLEE